MPSGGHTSTHKHTSIVIYISERPWESGCTHLKKSTPEPGIASEHYTKTDFATSYVWIALSSQDAPYIMLLGIGISNH